MFPGGVMNPLAGGASAPVLDPISPRRNMSYDQEVFEQQQSLRLISKGWLARYPEFKNNSSHRHTFPVI